MSGDLSGLMNDELSDDLSGDLSGVMNDDRATT
jgi:hypothetical protein